MTKISHDLFEASGGLKVAPCKKNKLSGRFTSIRWAVVDLIAFS